MKIIGAGLAGLLCGALNPGSIIYEKQSQLPNNHGALLRFRSDKISRALGIPFKKVRVTKAIWFDDHNMDPTPQVQNWYSYKVTGKYMDRSISNIDPVDRWIAPDDFTQQLADRCGIEFDYDYPLDADELGEDEPIISTMPMQRMMHIMAIPIEAITFEHQSIWTRVYELANCDLYQTIYFPDFNTSLYRASFTGNKLICEFIRNPDNTGATVTSSFRAFGLNAPGFIQEGTLTERKYGKIIPIDNDVRRAIMATLTREHNIYSLGRFATWRNILLDDVFEDIFKIRDMMNLDDYSRRILLAGK